MNRCMCDFLRFLLALSAAIRFVFMPAAASGGTYLVYPNGTGDFATIQDAINAAVGGDTILLGSGTFTGLGNKNLDTQGKAICITSICRADSTVIDCQSDGRAFYIHMGETNNTIIHAIRVMWGEAAAIGDQGGAIFCANASPTIIECIFERNYARWGGAIYASQSNARIIRNRFLGNNCWYRCLLPGAQPANEPTPSSHIDVYAGGSGIYCLDSDLEITDNYFFMNQTSSGYGAGICALNSTLTIVCNEFYNNGMFMSDNGGSIYADGCDAQVLGNYFHDCSGWGSAGICIKNSTGSVIANRLDDNYNYVGASIRSYYSSGTIGFNLLRDNSENGIELNHSTHLVHRNIVSRSYPACCGGRGIDVWNSPGAMITNNVLYENQYFSGESGSEIAYHDVSPLIKANVLVNPAPEAMVGCGANGGTIQTAIADTFYFVENVSEENYFFGNERARWNSFPCLPDPALSRFIDPMFCNPASDNWFLQEGSWCMVDTVIHIAEAGDEIFFHIYGFVGALPVGCSTSDVLLTTVPPDAEAANSLQPGDVYQLNGFSITNISDVEAPVYYELRFEGAAAPYDQGDPLAFGGVTPILQPGETFLPPEAALIVPAETPAVSTITYLVAYAPALNIPDTLTTTIFFDTSVPVALQSFTGSLCDEGVLLEWQVAEGFDIECWNIYRSDSRGAFRLVTSAPLPVNMRSYIDGNVEPGTAYRYRLSLASNQGEQVAGEVEVTTPPAGFVLMQNYPNPFELTTTIRFSLPERSRATLSIFDVNGRHVATLLDGNESSGPHSIEWNGRNDGSTLVSSGIYFCRLQAGKHVLTRRMVFMR